MRWSLCDSVSLQSKHLRRTREVVLAGGLCETSTPRGSLAGYLVDAVGLGQLHVSQAQQIAKAAAADGARDADLLRMSGLGSVGRWLSNAERDFHRAFLEPARAKVGLPLEPWLVPVPMVGDTSTAVQNVWLPLLAPHELFAAFYTHGSGKFRKLLVDDLTANELHAFWGTLRSWAPWASNHPALALRPGRSSWGNTIPILLHADEAEVFNDEKMYILSWAGLSHGDPWASRFLIGTFRSKLMVIAGGRNQTLDAIFKFVAWSLHILYLGSWPTRSPAWLREVPEVPEFAEFREMNSAQYRIDLAGKPLAGDCVGAFIGVKGDQHFFLDAFRLSRHFGCTELCRKCLASKHAGARLWTDLGAEWRDTVGQWETPVTTLDRVFGWHPRAIHDDLLHLLYVNGVANDLCASVICKLVEVLGFCELPGRNDQLMAGFVAFRQWARTNKVPCTAAKWTAKTLHWEAHEFPHLGGKAADVRLTVLFLASFLRECTLELDWVRQVRVCVGHLASFIHLIARSDLILTDADATSAQHSLLEFIRLYLALASRAVQIRELHFKVRPKLHYLWHLADELQPSHGPAINPNVFSCWNDESYMGRIAKLSAKTHKRSTPLRAIHRYMYVLAKHLSHKAQDDPSKVARKCRKRKRSLQDPTLLGVL